MSDLEVINEEETDVWWIDYMEGQVSPQVESDLESLLVISKEDRKSLAFFQKLKESILLVEEIEGSKCIRNKSSDLTSKVMKRILEVQEVEKPKINARISQNP